MEKMNKEVKSKKAAKVVKAAKVEKKASIAKPVNPLTGRKAGTKGDLVGVAILSSKDPVKAFTAALDKVRGFFEESKHSTEFSRVRRHTMSWVDFLKENHPKEFKDVLPAAEYSKAYREANKPAGKTDGKADKAPASKKPAAKKAAVKKPAAKKAAVKKPEAKKEEEQAGTCPAPTPNAEAKL